MQRERRTRRSRDRDVALAFFLESSRRTLGVRALTLGTADGRLVAGSGRGTQRLAALGAKADAGEPTITRIATWRMTIAGQTYVISSLGGVMHVDVGDGVRRILS
jgi:hypothetical protein